MTSFLYLGIQRPGGGVVWGLWLLSTTQKRMERLTFSSILLTPSSCHCFLIPSGRTSRQIPKQLESRHRVSRACVSAHQEKECGHSKMNAANSRQLPDVLLRNTAEGVPSLPACPWDGLHQIATIKGLFNIIKFLVGLASTAVRV